MHPLIDVTSLARSLDESPRPVVLDVRWRLAGPPGVDNYRRGHLPGAVFVDLERDLAGRPGAGGRHPLPATSAFEAAMRRHGVRADRAAVVYDDGDAMAAARAWWTLRYFGHQNVRVLEGGYRAWVDAGRPVTTAVPDVPPGEFTASPGGMPTLDAGAAAAVAREGTLVDARAPERYRGEAEPIDSVAGHVPGAVNVPTLDNLGAQQRFRPAPELRDRFAERGVSRGRPVGAYCGSGVSAAHEVLALSLAGIPASLYVGSWSDWIDDPSRPVATGDLPG